MRFLEKFLKGERFKLSNSYIPYPCLDLGAKDQCSSQVLEVEEQSTGDKTGDWASSDVREKHTFCYTTLVWISITVSKLN